MTMATSASAFSTRDGARVNQVNDVVFEVIGRSTASSAQQFWCAASEYARRALNAGWTDRVYLVQGRGQSVTTNRRSAVQFTMSPQAAGITPIENNSVRLNSLKPGESMSVQQANLYCSAIPDRF
ncbi:hypothetical protein K3727_13185 [Rhodobacteraceae bacterium M382]|nr:hypothetical protein K3727_13185 [Rhodobacteraceae bacterium M382]